MQKKALLAAVVVFLAWAVMDFLIHGVILQSSYASTPALWRPMQEMKRGVLYFAVFVNALAFCVIYAKYVARKSIGTGLMYGIWFGLGTGVAMGYGTYAVMPIPYTMALIWFLGHGIEAAVAGLIVASIVKE